MSNEEELKQVLEEIVSGKGTNALTRSLAAKTKAMDVLERVYGSNRKGMTARDIATALMTGPEVAPALEVVVRVDEEWASVTSVEKRSILIDDGDTEATACIVIGID